MPLMKVNGTYPHDSRQFPWKVVKGKLTMAEVVALIHPPEDLLKEVQEGGFTESWGWKRSLFINKGYVIIPKEPATAPAISSDSAGMLDGYFQVETPTPVGTQAVYMHDGFYSLIERINPRRPA